MHLVYFAPGFAGTFLTADAAGRSRVWVEVTELLLGKTRQLELAPDGSSPGPPYGIQLFASDPYTDYYATALNLLAEQLGRGDYGIRPHGFDWRLRIRDQGVILANRIRSEVQGGEQCTIVGHSQGGLLARAAWSDLVGTGQQGLVRRIVCLGTPHEGSYNIVGLMAGADDSAVRVALLDALGSAMTFGGPVYNGQLPLGLFGVAAIARTWPACYELLPMLDGAERSLDPNRSQLYDARNWFVLTRPPQSYLDYARDDFQPWLRSPASMPPANVMTSVFSTGFPTAQTLRARENFGTPGSFGPTDSGDSIATVLSATGVGSRLFECAFIHWDMTRQTVLSGDLAMLIREQGSVPPPPLFVGTTVQVAGVGITAPPTPIALSPGPDP
jgi:pimeloyl-ACP methyl ester carboxylesterase